MTTTDVCWNCGKALQTRADACLWCGAALAAPAGPAPATGPSAAVAPVGSSATVATAAPAASSASGPLGEAFLGLPAGTGKRLAAFTIDIVIIAAVGVAVHVGWGVLALTAAAVIDVLVLLWILEARTGITPGSALLGFRVSRADLPASPGALRSLVRAVITGAGLLIAGVGAWLVVATSAWDASGRRRSWADTAAGTLAVAVPDKASRALAYHAPRIDLASSTPDAVALPYATAPRGEGLPSTPPLPVGPPLPTRTSENSASLPGTAPAHVRAPGEPQHRPSALPLPATAPPGPAAPTAPAAPAPVAAPASEPASEGALLLVLDTGQREQLPLPAAVVLGRRPEAVESRDALITVTDPERTVSKSHLRLEHVDGQTWLTDLGSANGTWLIDEFGETRQAVAQQRLAVDFGTRVRVGERMLTVHVLGAEEATA